MDRNALIKSLRRVLREYENGTDAAACMAALSSQMEWLLDDHEFLQEDLYLLENQLHSRDDWFV